MCIQGLIPSERVLESWAKVVMSPKRSFGSHGVPFRALPWQASRKFCHDKELYIQPYTWEVRYIGFALFYAG